MTAPNFQVLMLAKGKARVEIYDVIGPSWLGMIDTKLVSKALAEAGELTDIEVRINSPGGDAFEGLGIHNVLKEHGGKVTVVIDGVAASAASLIAMAGDTVRIPSNAMMMLHEPFTFAFGTQDDLKKGIDRLAAVTTAGVQTYAAKTKQDSKKIAKWLKDETWFVGQEAVDAGLADTTEKEIPAEKMQLASSVRQSLSSGPRDVNSFLGISMQLKQEPPTMAADPKPKPDPKPDPAPNPPTPAPDPQTEPSPVKHLTQADVQATAAKAVADERTRVSSIMAVCQKAGKPDMASEFIANGTSLGDVQTRMFDVLCAARPPVGDAGGSDDSANPKDPDAALKKEYADNRATLQKSGVTEEDYVASRKVTDEHQGRVAMLPKPEKAKA